jgi:glycosidase
MKTSVSILFAALLFFSACEPKNSELKNFKLPEKDYIIGLASPINLKSDTTKITLCDYFPLRPKTDSIKTHSALAYQFSPDSAELFLIADNENLPKLSALEFYFGTDRQTILLKKSEKIKHTLTFNPKGKEYESVKMKGEMNAWNPETAPLKLEDGIWKTEIEIEPGSYQYIYVADGKEILDNNNPDSVSNGMGGYNSVLKAGTESDIQKPRLASQSFDDESLRISLDGKADKLFFLIDNILLNDAFYKTTGNSYNLSLPEALKNKERSYVRVYAYNTAGMSNDLLIPLNKGQIIDTTEYLERTDFRAATLYNAFIDRFNNAKPENDRPTPDPEIHPKANYHGGDIAGVTQKIKDGYFADLGINTVWISPVIKNPESAYGLYPEPETKFSAYHGYWPISFNRIDSRLGTAEELKELVKTAHENDMNVLLDFVANHIHEEHPYYKANPDVATNLYLPDGTLNTELWDTQRLTTWFDTFLPTLDLSKPKVYEMLTDSAIFWIKEYNLDGFRHDATKHVPEIFWQTLTRKLKTEVIIPENRPLYQIGETYGSPQLISSYVNTGQLDAQFDFNMYDVLVSILAGGSSFENAAETMQKSLKYYGHHHLMGNITGNQDRGRFISYASGSLQLSEDSKYAGWNREIGVDDPVGYKKAALLNTMVATMPGLPVIYYGDEIGMPGGNDPDNRRMMRFENLKKEEKELHETTAKLLIFRRQSMPLIFGETEILLADETGFIMKRNYFGKQVYVILNNSNSERTMEFETDISEKNSKIFNGSKITGENNKFRIDLPPNAFEIIYN